MNGDYNIKSNLFNRDPEHEGMLKKDIEKLKTEVESGSYDRNACIAEYKKLKTELDTFKTPEKKELEKQLIAIEEALELAEKPVDAFIKTIVKEHLTPYLEGQITGETEDQTREMITHDIFKKVREKFPEE